MSAPSKPQQAAIYVRISQDREGAGLGVKRQEEACRDLADREGWVIADVLTDNDVSAYSGKLRKEYRRLLAGLRDGSFDAVLAWHPDRLHRSPLELEQFIALVDEAKIQVRTVQSGLIDLSTPSGRLVARQIGAVARYESEHKSARARLKAAQDAESGRWSGGGTRGWGYTLKGEVIESEAKTIKQVVKLLLEDGYTKGEAARWLNEHQHLTPTGGLWRPSTLTRTLCSARLAGWRSHAPGAPSSERQYGSPFTTKGDWIPILTRDQVERLRIRLARRSRSRTRPDSSYILSGMVRHAGCQGDGRLVGAFKDDKRRYRCSPPAPIGTGCGGPTITANELEREVLDHIVYWLGARAGRDLAESERSGDDQRVSVLLDDLREVEQAIVDLGIDLDDKVITREEWRQRRPRLEERVAALRADLDGLELQLVPRVVGPSYSWAVEGFDRQRFRNWWNDIADEDARRAFLRRAIDQIDVLPAVPGRNVFDRERVVTRFADGFVLRGAEVKPGDYGVISDVRIEFGPGVQFASGLQPGLAASGTPPT